MGPIWGQQDPGGPNVGPMNPAIWDHSHGCTSTSSIALKFMDMLNQYQNKIKPINE